MFQVLGKVPLISLSKTDGAQIYVSPDSLQCEIGMLHNYKINKHIPRDESAAKVICLLYLFN
jgi:hypothetical protein